MKNNSIYQKHLKDILCIRLICFCPWRLVGSALGSGSLMLKSAWTKTWVPFFRLRRRSMSVTSKQMIRWKVGTERYSKSKVIVQTRLESGRPLTAVLIDIVVCHNGVPSAAFKQYRNRNCRNVQCKLLVFL